jgi:integrase
VRKMQSLTKADIVGKEKLHIIESLPPRERVARQFVIDSFTGKMPSLIPFALENKYILKLASILLISTSGSKYTLYQYVFGVHRFSDYLRKKPDDMIGEVLEDRSVVDKYTKRLNEFARDLQAEGLAFGTIANHVKGVKALFRANGIEITTPRLRRRVIYSDRSPSPEELAQLLDIADLREKVIISFLALGGFRVGTLVKLLYRHVKKDLEAGIVPIHVHVEAEITKGKYGLYDTFLGREAVDYLKAYVDVRRNGTQSVQPETIEDSSPVIRDERIGFVKPISAGAVHRLISRLYAKTNMRRAIGGKSLRYDLRVHSIRKYFRTQLGSSTKIPADYIDYMMGHIVSTYNDIQMKGIDYLRGLYALSGLSIIQKEKADIYCFVEDILKGKGYNIDKELLRRAISKPHRTVCSPVSLEEERRSAIRDGFMEMLRKEFLQQNLQTDEKKGASRENESGILYSTGW